MVNLSALETERSWSVSAAHEALSYARMCRLVGDRALMIECQRRANWAVRRAARFTQCVKHRARPGRDLRFTLPNWTFGGPGR